MAAEPNYQHPRIVVFPPCGACRKERWNEQEQERRRRNSTYVAQPFVDQAQENVPCRRHCPACISLGQECTRHWREGTTGGSATLSDVFAARAAAQAHRADHGTATGMAAPTDKQEAVTFAGPYLPANTDTLKQITSVNKTMFPSGPLLSRSMSQATLKETSQIQAPATMPPPSGYTDEEAAWLNTEIEKTPGLPDWLKPAAGQMPATPTPAPESMPDIAQITTTVLPEHPTAEPTLLEDETPTETLQLAEKTLSAPLPAVHHTANGDVIVGAPRVTGPMRLRYQGEKLLAEHCQRLLALKDDYLKLCVAAHQIVQDTEGLLIFAPEDIQGALRTIAKRYAALSEDAQLVGNGYVPEFPLPPDPDKAA